MSDKTDTTNHDDEAEEVTEVQATGSGAEEVEVYTAKFMSESEATAYIAQVEKERKESILKLKAAKAQLKQIRQSPLNPQLAGKTPDEVVQMVPGIYTMVLRTVDGTAIAEIPLTFSVDEKKQVIATGRARSVVVTESGPLSMRSKATLLIPTEASVKAAKKTSEKSEKTRGRKPGRRSAE